MKGLGTFGEEVKKGVKRVKKRFQQNIVGRLKNRKSNFLLGLRGKKFEAD